MKKLLTIALFFVASLSFAENSSQNSNEPYDTHAQALSALVEARFKASLKAAESIQIILEKYLDPAQELISFNNELETVLQSRQDASEEDRHDVMGKAFIACLARQNITLSSEDTVVVLEQWRIIDAWVEISWLFEQSQS